MAFSDDNRPGVSVGPVSFTHSQPNVSVQTSGRYVTHDVIGNTTVRQKIGTSPDEISIEGVCTGPEANQIDKLVNTKEVEVVSNRWEGTAQVASASTRPLADGGAIDTSGEWTHRFTIELVEVGSDKSDVYVPGAYDYA